MLYLLLILITYIIITFPSTALGSLVLFQTLIRGSRPPADKSNRINRLRLVWFSMTRPEMFVGIFPWLMNDELDNLKGNNNVL